MTYPIYLMYLYKCPPIPLRLLIRMRCAQLPEETFATSTALKLKLLVLRARHTRDDSPLLQLNRIGTKNSIGQSSLLREKPSSKPFGERTLHRSLMIFLLGIDRILLQSTGCSTEHGSGWTVTQLYLKSKYSFIPVIFHASYMSSSYQTGEIPASHLPANSSVMWSRSLP